jgi:hypothetical protein
MTSAHARPAAAPYISGPADRACGDGSRIAPLQGAGRAGTTALPPPTGSSALYNSAMTPYAVLTGPYAYLARGAALRDQGYGSFNLTWPGGNGTLIAAYLVWAILDNSVPAATATLNGVNITGTWTAYASPSPCWSPMYIYTFVDPVTNLVGSGVNTLTNVPSGITNGFDPWNQSQTVPMDEGASLIVVYDTNSTLLHQVSLYTGDLPVPSGGAATSQLNYSTTNSTLATTTYLVADGQLPGNTASWNGTVIDANAFPGDDPKSSPYSWSYGNLSDTRTLPVTVTLGGNNTTAGVASNGADCLTWVGQVLSVGVAASAPPYPVVFQEQGLPNGQVWNVTTHGVTHNGTVTAGTSALTFLTGNGTRTYTVGQLPGYTTIYTGTYVVHGGSVYIRVPFHQILYQVTFNETGLPTSTYWSADLTNVSQSVSLGNSVVPPTPIAFQVGNGSYQFTASDLSLYLPSPANGTIRVNGSDLEVNITFLAPPLYNVTFVENGLLTGAVWGGNTYTNWGNYLNSTTNRSFSLFLPNATLGSDTLDPVAVTGFLAPPYIPFAVNGAPETIDVNYSTLYGVTLTETGLPSGTSWYASMYGSVSGYAGSTTSTLSFLAANGTYSFYIDPVWAYTATPSGGSITVAGANATAAIVFSPSPRYAVTFNASGLPGGTHWSVSVTLPNGTVVTQNSTNATDVFSEPNGSYFFEIGTVLGYSASPSAGYAYVYGADVNESITFTRVYAVTFTETGLPSGSYWVVALGYGEGYSYSPSIVVWEPNGSYSFTAYGAGAFTPSPGTGSVNVSGAGVNVTIVYSDPYLPTFNIAFVASGLPVGVNWTSELNYYSEWSTGTTINYTEPNGTYGFSVAAVGAYQPVPASGDVTVNGSSVTENITFSAATNSTYLVTFTESGLPDGATFYVNLSGEPVLSATVSGATDASVSIQLGNGSYTYVAATDEPGWRTSAGGNLDVAGAALSEPVPFTGPSVSVYAVTFTESGLPDGATWYANVSGDPSLFATVAGSSGTTLAIDLPNGSYSYAISTNAPRWSTTAGGSTMVAGSPVSILAPFTYSTVPLYSVTFTESSLPVGATWWVNLTGQPSLSATVSSTSGTSLAMSLPNGSYTFSASTSAKDWTTTAGGPISVAGAARSVPVPFTFSGTRVASTYTVTFTESGLPVGSIWWVNISGQSSLSTTVTSSGGTQLTITLGNASYAFEATSNAMGWSAKGGSFTIAGSDQSVSVPFTSSVTPAPPGSTSTGTGSPFPWVWAGAGLAALLALLLLLLVFRRRRKKEPENAGPGSGPSGGNPPSPS